MSKKILYILKHDPWAIGGGAYACRMYLTAFRSLFKDAEIDVLICDNCMNHQPLDWANKCNFIAVPPRRNLSLFMFPFTGIMHRHQKVAKRLLKKNKYDYCIFDHNHIAGSLVDYVPNYTKTLVIHHNVEQNYFRDNSTSFVSKYVILPYVIRWEKNAYEHCDYNIFLTKEDMFEFKKLYGVNKGKNSVIGIFDVLPFLPNANTTNVSSPTIVISGSLDNFQNLDGIRYFINDLYPHIPDYVKIIISGKNPKEEIISLVSGKNNISLIPNPDNMNKVIQMGNIYICATRLGSGIKVRIADGLRNGLPVIAHQVSARGYSDYVEKGVFYPFSTPKEFDYAINHVIKKYYDGKWNRQEIIAMYQCFGSLSAGIQKLRSLLLE